MSALASPVFDAVLDAIAPDPEVGALALGADVYVRTQLAGDSLAWAVRITEGLAGLDAAGFAAADADARTALLVAVEREGWFRKLVELVAEGVYADPANGGNAGAKSWERIGYDHRLPDGPDGPPAREPRHAGPVTGDDFDVIVVGAGAGGGTVAALLAEAGKSVLLVERGPWRSYADSGRRDHLRNQRLSLYGTNAGPEDGEPRVYVGPDGREQVVEPYDNGYHNNAAGVGSGTLVYGAMAWRFHPDDFRMASRYGVPTGSSLTDWPVGYDDLAPWYERAEWEIGVAGDRKFLHGAVLGKGYPMPAFAGQAGTAVLQRGADALGLHTFTPPFLINTVPYSGRGACIGCGSCVGFPCPTDAKNGTQNTMIPRGLATGRMQLVTDTTVERVETDGGGKVTGVALVSAADNSEPTRRSVRAKAVVLSGGAIETARLLLLSASGREPQGLGNGSDLVGRNLQGHYYPTAYGLFDEVVAAERGPGVTIATTDFNHGNPGIVGGGLLSDDFIMLPIIFWRQAFPEGERRWGADAEAFMRDGYRRVTQIKGPVHEIPDPVSRVTLDANVKDQFGRPVARLSGVAHEETMRSALFMHQKALEWMRASGAKRVWGSPPRRQLSGGQHQAGTCRMGSDPAASVTDPFGRVWGHDNLFISDGSLHPTNGGFNPVLTILALAFRNAAHIAQSL